MKLGLFITTALSGFFVAGLLTEANATSVPNNSIVKTVTTTYTYEFPKGKPVINKDTKVTKNCPRREPPGHDRGECGCETCFDYHTLVLMADGSTKKIGTIVAGDETAYGVVHQTFVRRFDQSVMLTKNFQQAYLGGLYRYKGVLVTGNHMMHENRQWLSVAHAPGVVPVLDLSIEHVYNLDVEGGIIPVIDEEGAILAFLDDKQAYVADRLSA